MLIKSIHSKGTLCRLLLAVALLMVVPLVTGGALADDKSQETAVVADFTGSPIFSQFPLDVSFTDESTGNPTGWTWYFGNEDFQKPWEPLNPASWLGRSEFPSVVLPDGSIVLMGGAVYLVMG